MRDNAGKPRFLLQSLSDGFEVLYVKNGARPNVPEGIKLTVIGEDLIDGEGKFAERFDATPGAAYILRPDQHLCARMRIYDGARVRSAVKRAKGKAS